MKKISVALIVFCMFGSGIAIRAQNAIPASGGNATGTGSSSVSYTVGQVFYTVITNSGSMAQGVQQPYEISVVTAIESAKDINVICSAYPNPTTEFLTLKVKNFDMKGLSYWLYSVSGTLIETKKVLVEETQISLVNQFSGTYFLKVTSGNIEIKTFKIIKN